METFAIILLTVAAFALGGFVGFRVGLHLSMLGVWNGAKRRLTADEWATLDTLMDKALGGEQ